jgi:murein peptide amidase A
MIEVQPVVYPFWYPLLTATSRQGRPISLLFPEGVSPEAGTIDMLIMAAFHGDEPESAWVLEAFLNRVSARELGAKRVGIIPVANPDGLFLKTRQTSTGVDMNRNFPTQDWASLGQGTPYFSGSAPASEPETQFIVHVLSVYPPQAIMSLHTPYRVINYDGPAEALAQKMSEINGYEVVADIGYPTPGSFGTYTGKERDIPTLTLELPEKEAFTENELQSNLAALLHCIL